MKSTLFVLLIWLSAISVKVFGQQQDVNAPFYYQVSGLVYAYEYEYGNQTQLISYKIPKPGLKFSIVRRETNSEDDYEYYIIKFLPIINDDITVGNNKLSLNNDYRFINSENNDDYYWIKKGEFDKLLEDKVIVKSFLLTGKPAYGANVSLPFKLRPKTAGQNQRITPDITLGGYLGWRWRLSKKEPMYVTAPIVTLGLSTLPISDETDGTTPNKGDGTVLGTTVSTGAVFQFDDFQFGFMMGWDHAAGEIGRNWLYNGKPWFSFSIGFSFIGNKKAADDK